MSVQPATSLKARRTHGGEGSRVHDEPGYILHATPYRETSLVLQAFTRTHGRVPLVAKGAKRPTSQLRPVLVSLQPLLLNWSGRGEVKTLTAAHWVGGQAMLKDAALLCGFYMNELLLKLTAREDPHERLFDAYTLGLADLAAGTAKAVVLRRFEHALLREIGLGIELDRCADGEPVEPEVLYVCIPEFGVRLARNGDDPDLQRITGRALQAIEQADYSDPATVAQAKPLMRGLIHHALSGRALATRQLLLDIHAL